MIAKNRTLSRCDSGIMTIDASISIFFLVVIFYFTLTTALLMRSDVILHTMATHSAKELGQYSALVTVLNNKDSEQKTNIINLATSFMMWKHAQSQQFNELQKQVIALLDDNTNNNGVTLNDIKDNRVIVQFLAKEFFKQYVPGVTDMQKTIYLKRLGVLGGLDGLSFAHSKIFKRNKEWYVQIAVSCRLRGLYFQFLNYYHFIRHKIIVKVW